MRNADWKMTVATAVCVALVGCGGNPEPTNDAALENSTAAEAQAINMAAEPANTVAEAPATETPPQQPKVASAAPEPAPAAKTPTAESSTATKPRAQTTATRTTAPAPAKKVQPEATATATPPAPAQSSTCTPEHAAMGHC